MKNEERGQKQKIQINRLLCEEEEEEEKPFSRFAVLLPTLPLLVFYFDDVFDSSQAVGGAAEPDHQSVKVKVVDRQIDRQIEEKKKKKDMIHGAYIHTSILRSAAAAAK